MKTQSFLAVAAVAILLAAPAGSVLAAGTWLAGGGSFEPSTTYDTPSVMFQTPNTDLDPVTGKGVDKVYFNAYAMSMHATNEPSTDNNLDGGNILSPTGNTIVALLGFWRDCNGDGYIGAKTSPTAYGSLGSYPTSLGFDSNVCPPGSPYWLMNPVTGEPNAMIDEFRWIGPGAGCDPYETGCPGSQFEHPARVCAPLGSQPPNSLVCAEGLRAQTDGINDVTDNSSRVWGDWERPGGAHVPYGPLLPFPRGTFEDSDGTLEFVDDATLRTVSATLPGWDTKPNIGACNQPNPTFLGGPGGTCGAYPLWQARRAMNDTTCTSEGAPEAQGAHGCWEPDPLVTTWETDHDADGDGNPCNDGFYQEFYDPRDNSIIMRVALPDVAIGANPNALADGSLSGTLEHQQRGLNGTTAAPGSADQNRGTCGDDRTDSFATAADGFPAGGGTLETDSSDSQLRHVEPSMVLNFTADTRFHQLAAYGFYDIDLQNTGGVIGGPSGTVFGPGWFSNVVWTGRPPRTGWGFTTTAWSTFYADVSNEAFTTSGADPAIALPGGGQDRHVYGVEYCPSGFTTGGASHVDAGTHWECNIDQWKENRERYELDERERYGAVVSDPYDLRDVDCYDNSLSEDSAYWGSALTGLRAGLADCSL